MRKTCVLTVAIALLSIAPSSAQDAKGVRRIAIPHREHGYGNFKSQVITSQDQLDAFLKSVEKQQGWNNRKEFLEALGKAKIDFTNEVLVFVRNTEGSGSNKVTFAPIELKEGKAISRIERKVAGIGTADIADYCLAVTIPRKDLTAVEVWVDKKQREVLKVGAK